MSSDDTRTIRDQLLTTRESLAGLESATVAARSSLGNELSQGGLVYDATYGSVADCVMYTHYAGAYAQAAQAMLESGDLTAAEHLVQVGLAYAGSAGDCLDQFS